MSPSAGSSDPSLFALLALSVWNFAYPYALIRADEARLDEARLARAWPPHSRTLACLAFGPIALLVHFPKTRRTGLGFLLGIVAFGVALVPGLIHGEGP